MSIREEYHSLYNERSGYAMQQRMNVMVKGAGRMPSRIGTCGSSYVRLVDIV